MPFASNDPPEISLLVAIPDPATVGDALTLTSDPASDPGPDGAVVRVTFYREGNGSPGLQTEPTNSGPGAPTRWSAPMTTPRSP